MNPAETGFIDHPQDDQLQLYVKGCLNPAKMDVLDGHVSICAECRSRLGEATRFAARIVAIHRGTRPGADKRSEPRFRSSDAGFLRCFSPVLADRWPVQVADVSKSGLGILISVQLPRSALVQVRIAKTVVLAEVVYFTPVSEIEFRIGLRLVDVFWSNQEEPPLTADS